MPVVTYGERPIASQVRANHLNVRLMRGQVDAFCAQIEAEAKVFQTRMKSAEAQEAFAAFFEKRPPDFAKLRRKP